MEYKGFTIKKSQNEFIAYADFTSKTFIEPSLKEIKAKIDKHIKARANTKPSQIGKSILRELNKISRENEN